jgi:hypothetical protein
MRNRKNDGEDLENTDGRVADASSSPMILTEREIMAEINQTSIPKVAGPMPSEDSKRDEVKLRRLLGTTARRLAAVRGPICSDYDTGREMAQFVLECRRRIEHGMLDVIQLQELWRIFAPAGDWDKVVGDAELGNEVFALLNQPCRVG